MIDYKKKYLKYKEKYLKLKKQLDGGYIPYKRDSFILYDKPATYNIFIYKSMNGRDMYIGSTTAHSSHTIKQILDNFKVSGKVCIVSYETQIVTSLNHQDFDITLDLLHLEFPKIKLYIL